MKMKTKDLMNTDNKTFLKVCYFRGNNKNSFYYIGYKASDMIRFNYFGTEKYLSFPDADKAIDKLITDNSNKYLKYARH